MMNINEIKLNTIVCFFAFLFSGVASSQDNDIIISREKNDEGEVFVYAENTSYSPYTVKLDATLTGFIPDNDLPLVKVVPGKTKEVILKASMKPGLKKYGYSFKTNSFMGNLYAEHDDDYTYTLPFKKGASYVVSQGYYGRVSHHGLRALDFNMDEGTEVHAIRGGIVVDMKEDSSRGCPSDECLNMANFITVLHDDHSFSHYAHLKQYGVLVNIGDKIETGDLIGYSGKTGWATGPHLHIEVYMVNKSDDNKSVSTYFNVGGRRTLLKKGDKPTN